MKKQLNKWQKFYVETYCGGKLPKRNAEVMDLLILDEVKDSVTVHFPEFKSPIASQCHPAEVRTFTVTFTENNMPEGRISVLCLLSNLKLWESRGYEIEY